MISDVFEGYARQYVDLSAKLSRKCSFADDLPKGAHKELLIADVKSGLVDAGNMIRKMDLEARSLQPSVKGMMLAKLGEYNSDLNQLKREVKKLTNPNSTQTANELASTHSVSANQRDQMMMMLERLDQSSDRIRESGRGVATLKKESTGGTKAKADITLSDSVAALKKESTGGTSSKAKADITLSDSVVALKKESTGGTTSQADITLPDSGAHPTLYLYNVLTGRLEEFEKNCQEVVRLYGIGFNACKPAHIGIARLYLGIDILSRILTYLGYRVEYVQPFNDLYEGFQSLLEDCDGDELLPEYYCSFLRDDLRAINCQLPNQEPLLSNFVN